MIQVSHLVKRFGPLVAVDDLSFEVGAGELFGFLGPNGAGKTTTINILCTLLKPTSGGATVAGFDVLRQPYQVRRSIGIIFQDPSLDERLTALENLRIHSMLYRIPKERRGERIGTFLDMMGLWERRNDLVKTYSGGMKRRLEIARGLLHQPKVLFLDEPTIGLDPQTRTHIWRYLLELRQQEKVTIFLTTHSMEEADRCDRVAILDCGRKVVLDAPEALKRSIGHGTLEDVFLKMTGRQIREEGASSTDQLRLIHKKWIGPPRHR